MLAVSGIFEGNIFLSQITSLIDEIIINIVEFMSNPEKYFSELFGLLLDFIFDKTMISVVIPSLTGKDMNEICESIQAIDFSQIDRLIKGYMAKIIAIIAVVLVLYNYFNFIVTIETERDEDDEVDKQDKGDSESEKKKKSRSKVPLSSLWNCIKWLKNFLKYPPFWIFLCMGTFGVLHIKFSKSLRKKAEELISNYVEPTIEEMKKDFVTMMKNYVIDLETMWRKAFLKLTEPFKNFIEGLTKSFGITFDQIVKLGKQVLDAINILLTQFYKFTTHEGIRKAIYAILDLSLIHISEPTRHG